ncbi:DNA cytosine methyltransferase [Streptomyces sp. NPDC056697]|uniref:DNA cytosine methyltransferase n=1 Tax=Streptomyces sp. NPDC056697 TaxID=3345915 RepID=UPI0036CCBD35
MLAVRYPDAPNIGDITAFDWRQLVGHVDVLTAGWPCQGVSEAGHRRGLEDERSGIWRNVAEAIGVLRPRLAFLENVSAIRRHDRGGHRVLSDLADIGYDVRWTTVRAADVEGAHHRSRTFLAATPSDAPRFRRSEGRPEPAWNVGGSDAPVAHSPAAWWISEDGTDYGPAIRRWERAIGRPAPYPTAQRRKGAEWRECPRFAEWMMGLPDGWITDVPGISAIWQLHLAGNGVVPQQAYAAGIELLSH